MRNAFTHKAWQDISVSDCNTHFILNDNVFHELHFETVLKFHSPGLAAVQDSSGWYHLTDQGTALYGQRYQRAFGFYFNRASVVSEDNWFHITEKGERAYSQRYAWTGNYQEELCTVRDVEGRYFHIDREGEPVYNARYSYAGDFRDGIASVKTVNGLWTHIRKNGELVHNKWFLDLGVFHKGIATGKDERGWHHIDTTGSPLYASRFSVIEPFYNGYALVTDLKEQRQIINEAGECILII